jgi:hypothetical protein
VTVKFVTVKFVTVKPTQSSEWRNCLCKRLLVCCAARDDNDGMMIYTNLENCALLVYCAASSGNLLPTFRDMSVTGNFTASSGNFLQTFRDNLPVPSSGAKNLWILGPWNTGPIGCPETSLINYHYSQRNNPEERSSQVWCRSRC